MLGTKANYEDRTPSRNVLNMMLEKLVIQFLKVKEDSEGLKPLVFYLQQLLSSKLAISVVKDENSVIQAIQKKKHMDGAIRIAQLADKVKYDKKWEILYLFLQIQRGGVEPVQVGEGPSFLESFELTSFKESEMVSLPIPEKKIESQEKAWEKFKEIKMKRVNKESELVREGLFLMQGIDGMFIGFDNVQNEYKMKKPLRNTERRLLMELAQSGWNYKIINEYIEQSKKGNTVGLMNQFVATLESHFNSDSLFSLKRIISASQMEIYKLKLLSSLCRLCSRNKFLKILKVLKGSDLLTVLYNFTTHGDVSVKTLMERLINEATKPFFKMINLWINEGVVEDPFDEFFVACKDNSDNIWRNKYYFRKEYLPCFIPTNAAEKIFSLGKSINFMRAMNHEISEKNILNCDYEFYSEMAEEIEILHYERSEELKNILLKKYRLVDNFKALKKYLLLGQGDFVQTMLDLLSNRLDQSAENLFRHNLTGILETAIRSSNAQFDHEEILKRLDVRLLPISNQDTGWDVFSLDFHINFPLNTIIDLNAMEKYLRLFQFLWRIKRLEHNLINIYKDHMSNKHIYSALKDDIDFENLKIHTLLAEMNHFLNQLQYFIQFEVIELSWIDFLDKISQREIDIDKLITSHDMFLSTIEKGCLLNVILSYLFLLGVSLSIFNTLVFYHL
ncbi:hypothetical protein ROZALSC1DRAFT_27485 [Rozella allomycis CSF55]|uniref:Gamma tubulin complex protein 3 domain-containing protein n=1 Tax=Rozella allomycis (strain CSF55) TaxID=988480 RepID=A0A075AMY6_ROZAC|nr:Gamma tubulin complex protein 3 domain-containing protein [Rozella allomycis CSF55]RKP21063.1 hypothetical protein ROZALSC1DRAFT_27485 [Rozella allomycis CSF55]|eukprot:EPZ31071.1 Gamma tubulin complex protein 3 domain-containing protein [Rozella allomycis CSF55]